VKDVYAGLTTGRTDCHLCDLTFGRILKDRSWKRFVDDLPYDVTFEMRSTFCKRSDAPLGARFPAVYLDAPAGLVEVIARVDLDSVEDLDGLRALGSQVIDDFEA
jgi:hypothetical protein